MNTTERILLTDIPFQADISRLAQAGQFSGDPEDPELRALWARASEVARPKAIILLAEVLHDADGSVTAIGGQRMRSVVLDRQLRERHRVFPYLATCGAELGEIPYGSDPKHKAALFTFRMLALGEALRRANEAVMQEFGVRKLGALNPGSLPEWPLSEQRKLFSMLGDGPQQIGVTLGDDLFMFPAETSSGLLFETEQDYKNCMVCTRLDCIGRQAPYDAEQAKELRGS